jgi:hypothetical protein
MKTKADVVCGWLRKAASAIVTLEAGLGAGAFDGACFHAQQAAEKYLKGFLAFHDKPFPLPTTWAISPNSAPASMRFFARLRPWLPS